MEGAEVEGYLDWATTALTRTDTDVWITVYARHFDFRAGGYVEHRA